MMFMLRILYKNRKKGRSRGDREVLKNVWHYQSGVINRKKIGMNDPQNKIYDFSLERENK